MLEWLYYTLFFLLPLIFYPKTSEVFEFNKMVIVYIFTTLIVAVWVIKIIKSQKIIFKRTLLDIPLLIFLASQILSTAMSIDPKTSLLGYYSRFDGGLLSTICFSLLYWAFVTNFNKEKILTLIKITLVGAALVAIYGIMEHFGGSVSCVFVNGQFNDNCWVQDVKTRVFATLGQPNWLAAMLISLSPLAWYLAIKQKLKSAPTFLWTLISLLLFVCILFTKSRSGLLALAAADIVFWTALLISNFKKFLLIFLCLHLLFFASMAIFGTEVTPSLSQILTKQKAPTKSVDQGEGGTESGAIRAIVWKGAVNIWQAYPVFGTGVETFGLSYWQFRPVEHNNTSEWNYLYNKAHNEYLNFLANSGLVGFTSYLIIIIIAVFQILKSKDQIKIPLFAGFISILITNFFGFSVVVISLFTFLFPAIALEAGDGPQKNDEDQKLANNQKFLVAVTLVVTSFILFSIARYWLADYLYAQSKAVFQEGLYKQSIINLQQALNYNDEAIYHNELTRIFTDLSVNLNDAGEATAAAKLAPYAISESDIALAESPRNMNIRETRMSMFMELSILNPQYLNQAIDFTQNTIPLSPTDPKLELILGKAYANSGQLNKAVQAFQKALKLKPDYLDAQKDLQIIQKLQDKKK